MAKYITYIISLLLKGLIVIFILTMLNFRIEDESLTHIQVLLKSVNFYIHLFKG